MGAPLYRLATEYQLLGEELDSGVDVDSALALVMDAIEVKCGNIVKVVRSLDLEAEMYKTEAARIGYMARKAQERADWLREYVRRSMEQAGIGEIKSDVFTIRLQRNPESVEVTDESKVPDDYMVYKEVGRVDKVEVMRAWKEDGEVVEGTRIVQTTRLVVK